MRKPPFRRQYQNNDLCWREKEYLHWKCITKIQGSCAFVFEIYENFVAW